MCRRVVFLQKAPTPYNDYLFRALSKDTRLALEVHYLWPSTAARPWTSPMGQGYRSRRMRLRMGVDWRLARQAAADRHSLYIVADWAHPANVGVLLTRLANRLPVALRVDTPQEQLPRRQPKKWLRSHFLRWLLPRVNAIFATSAPAFRVLKSLGARDDQLIDFPFYVPLQPRIDTTALTWPTVRRQLRARVGCDDDGLVFAMAGTMVPKKGMDLAVRALAAFQQTLERRSSGLLIAGDGPQRAEIESLAHELGVSKSVVVLGWQEPEQLEATLLACDALIHSARYDPFPVAVLDAMRLGRAVIGSDACGSVEARVRHGANGLVFSSGDARALAAALLEIGKAPECLAAWGQCARETAEQWPVARGVETVWQQVARWVPHESNPDETTLLQADCDPILLETTGGHKPQ